MKKNRGLALAVAVLLLAAVGGGAFLYFNSPNRAPQKPQEPPRYRIVLEQDITPPADQLKARRVVLTLSSEVTGRQAVEHYLSQAAAGDILQVITPDGHFVALRTATIKSPEQIPAALQRRVLLEKRPVLAWSQGPYTVYRLEE
jgi:hypothetical protein